MKISLAQQIDEIDRELKQRENVYPRLVSTGRLRQSIADYQVERLKAARKTLVWVLENKTELRKHFNIEETDT